MPQNIFVSYSHADSSLVVPVVALLRASKALVFQDADTIRPGKRWREEVSAAISAASVVVVFWCHHAKNSQEVEKEFIDAIAHGKDVLPLLLDETPLPSNLADFQYIDFREAFRKGHGIEPSPPQCASVPAKGSRAVLFAGIVIAVILAAIGIFSSLQDPLSSSAPDNVRAGKYSIGILLSTLVIGLVLLVDFLRRRLALKHQMTLERAPEIYRIRPSDIAKTIEAELIRRTGERQHEGA